MRDYKASLYINGASGVASLSNTGLSGDVAFSMSCWCNVHRELIGTYSPLLMVGAAVANAGIFLSTFGGKINAELYGVVDKPATMSLQRRQWVHVTLTYHTAQAVKIYVNGEVVLSTTFGAAVNLTNAPFLVGNFGGVTSSAFINDACLWNRALTAAEVYSLANAGIVPSSGLIRRYPLDEGYGAVAYGAAPLADPLVDGNMEAVDTAAWTASNATLSKQGSPHAGARCLRVASPGTNNNWATQAVAVNGNTYRLRGYARSDGTQLPRVTTFSGIVWTGTNSTNWQEVDVTFSAANNLIYIGMSGTSGYVEWDDVTLIPYDNGTITAGTWVPNSANKIEPALRNYNASVVINGTNQHIRSLSNTGVTGTAAFSMSTWFKGFTSVSAYSYLLGFGTPGAAGHSFFLTLYTPGTVVALLESTGLVSSANGIVQPGRWQHFGVSVSTAGLVKIYVDGALVGQGSPGAFDIADGRFYAGNSSSGTPAAGGNVVDSCMWNRELTADEFYKMHRAGITPSSGLIRRYKSTEGSGTVWYSSAPLADPVTNGNFEGAAGPPPAGWTDFQLVTTRVAGTRPSGLGSYVAHSVWDGVNASGVIYQSCLVVGDTYNISFWARASGTDLSVQAGLSPAYTISPTTTWTYYSLSAVCATDGLLRFTWSNLSAPDYGELDDIVVTPYDNATITNGVWSHDAPLKRRST